MNSVTVALYGLRELEDELEAEEFLNDESFRFTEEEKRQIKSWLITCRGFTF
jgi:hypothetical protein